VKIDEIDRCMAVSRKGEQAVGPARRILGHINKNTCSKKCETKVLLGLLNKRFRKGKMDS